MEKFNLANISIKYKFIIGIVLILVFAMAVLSVVFIKRSEGLLIKALESKADLINRNFSIIAAQGIEESSFFYLQNLINEVAAKDKEIKVLVVAYPNGIIIATSDDINYRRFSKIQNEAIIKQEDVVMLHHKLKLLESVRLVYSMSTQGFDDTSEPELINSAEPRMQLGFIYIALDITPLGQEIRNLWVDSTIIAFIIMLIGIVCAYWFGTKMAKPIKKLAENVRIIASGNLDNAIYSNNKDEIGQLIFDVESMRIAIKNLTENLKEQERLKHDMELAKRIQTALIPRKPKIFGYEIAASCEPSEEVGGDYFDVISVKGYDWIVIGDVSGHGVTAGLVMMMVQTAIHTVLIQNPKIQPSRLLSIINRTIYENITRMDELKHVTIIVMAYGKDGFFDISGLHEDVLFWCADTGKIEKMPTDGMWIGLEHDISDMLPVTEFRLGIGDCIVLYTDGIIEAKSKEGSFFGMEKLEEIIREHGSKPVTEIHDAIIEALKDYDKPDDVTLLVMKRVSPDMIRTGDN